MDTSALRDVFLWARRCAENGGLVSLQGWLIHFRDVTRLREIREVCLTLELRLLTRECDRLLDRWENGEWDAIGEEVEKEFDRMLRAEELAEAQRNAASPQDLEQGTAATGTSMNVMEWEVASKKYKLGSMGMEAGAHCIVPPVREAGIQGQGVDVEYGTEMEDVSLVHLVQGLSKTICEGPR